MNTTTMIMTTMCCDNMRYGIDNCYFCEHLLTSVTDGESVSFTFQLYLYYVQCAA